MLAVCGSAGTAEVAGLGIPPVPEVRVELAASPVVVVVLAQAGYLSVEQEVPALMESVG